MEASKFLVGGKWRSSAAARPVVNPYDRRVVGEVYQATARDIDDAIQSAATAFEETRQLESHQRSDILSSIAKGISTNKGKIASLITSETGKPIMYSRSEVERSIFTFQYAAEEAKRIEGVVLPLDLAAHSSGRFGILQKFPLGVIGAITPFNFPINLVAHKLAPAIAAGNTFVLKPSSNAPLTALFLGRLMLESGFPSDAINIIPCGGAKAGQLVTDERVKLISFTGSPAVGWALKARAGKKRVVLELGGNAGVVVDKDASLPAVVRRIAMGSYGNAGQSCIAVQRVFVDKEVYDRFLSEFVFVSKSIKVGDPNEEGTVVGPMIDESAARKVEGWIAEAAFAGAHVLCGGTRTGSVLEPTVITNAKAEMKVCCHEVFAPVTTIELFETFEEAVAMVNDSAYGLQAGVFTNDFSHVLYAYKHLEVGGVVVNDYPTFRIDHMPYGGVKESGFGREGIKYAIEEMMEPKLLVVNQQSSL